MDPHESTELSPLLKNKKEEKYYLDFPWKSQRCSSFRAMKNVPIRDQYSITPAGTKVFATTELVHEILSQIPVEHLASARRVSKTWNTVVQKSALIPTTPTGPTIP